MILEDTMKGSFPRSQVEWVSFKRFVDSCTEIEQRAQQLISFYNSMPSIDERADSIYQDIEELQRQLRGLLINEPLVKQLNEIVEILRCRRIIDTKISLEIGEVFSQEEVTFLSGMMDNLAVLREAVDE